MSRAKRKQGDEWIETEEMRGVTVDESDSSTPYIEPSGQPNRPPRWFTGMRALCVCAGVVILLFTFIVASVLLHRSKYHWFGNMDRTVAAGEGATMSMAVALWRLVPGFGQESTVDLPASCRGKICPDLSIRLVRAGGGNAILAIFPALYECDGCDDDKLWMGPLPAWARPSWPHRVPVTVWFSDIVTTHNGWLDVGTDGEITVTPDAWDLEPARGEHLRFKGPTDPVVFIAQN